MIPNLYVDHVSPVPLARTVDVCGAMENNSQRYQAAFAAEGVTRHEASAVVDKFCTEDAWYGALPRHIQAMAGRRRNGQIYVLRNVVVPSMTMGWTVALPDGLVVYVPRVCGNPSINRGRRKPKSAVYVLPVPVGSPQPVTMETAPLAPPVVGTPVVASAPVTEAEVTQPLPERRSSPWLVLPFVAPIITWFAPRIVPPCSGGSNTMGVCR